MSLTPVLKITYAGDILTDVVTTSPWESVTAVFPEYGGIPYMPQFHLDVLQPVNMDGARYRIGGSHFPRFTLVTIFPAVDYTSAQIMARDMEAIKGEPVTLDTVEFTQVRCQVINVRAVASGKQVINAIARGNSQSVPGGGAFQQTAYASVDAQWTLQVVAE